MITRKLTQKNIKLKRPQHSHLHYRNQPPSIHWNLIHNLRFGFRCKHLKSTGQSISDWHSPPNAIHNLSDWHSKFVPPAIRHWGFTLHLNPLSRSQCDGDRHDIISVHYNIFRVKNHIDFHSHFTIHNFRFNALSQLSGSGHNPGWHCAVTPAHPAIHGLP